MWRSRSNQHGWQRATIFQGLAADGAKLGLWRLWRSGYRIANFIHDEVLIEVPEDSDLQHHAETIRRLMIESMREVVPDVRIEVEYAASRRWHKDAKAVHDDDGRLMLWEPPSLESAIHAATADDVLTVAG